jgi:hypothetical protein
MDFKQPFLDLYWNPAARDALPGFILSLLTAALLALALGLAYVRFGSSLSSRRQFARTFVPLAVTTALIISIVKSSLALSLGLVGALSIVRFRAAIKEPEELVFLFLAISVGLGLGAGQGLITVVALAIILGLIALRKLTRESPTARNLFLTITHPEPDRLSTVQILEVLSNAGIAASLTRFDESPDFLRASFQVNVRDAKQLESFSRALRARCAGVDISCLDDQGIAA